MGAKFLEVFSGMGELRDVTERGDEGRCSEGDAALADSGAEAAVSEEEWLPLISDALATATHGKVAGPDALPAELLKAGGIWLLPHLARWTPRAMMAGVPEGWRGRPNGSSLQESDASFHLATLQNSRGLLHTSVAGKVVAIAVRSQQVGPLATEAGARQHGAVPRSGTEFPSHACRLFLKEAARIRRPAAVLFTDLGSAFYSVLPELALGAILSSRTRDQVLDALGIAGERQGVAACWRKMAADFRHCRGAPAAASRSEMEVQRCGPEEAAGRQLGGRACEYEASLRSEGCQVSSAICFGHAAVWGGGDLKERCIGRHGMYVPGARAQA